MTERRTVLITGGSRGLGAALVQAFLDDGDAVATCSRTVTPAVEAWQGERFHHEAIDLVDPESRAAFVDGVVERFAAIDVLVNNAGVARDGVLGLARDEDVDTVVDLNLKTTIAVTRLVARRMLLQGSGRIVNISSVAGLTGYRGLSIYGAAKAGLDGFTRGLARELAPRGITVNSVAPGFLRTDMTASLGEEQVAQIVRRTPAGRLVEADDVVGAVRYLTSPEAGFVTGTVLVVDGGLTA